jgi:uncharacterized damage-inducible protein DinB
VIPPSLVARLETQLDALDAVLAGATAEALEARPRADEWSARENLAHLARHAHVFLERLRRIVDEDRPRLGRYRAEEDPEWPAWQRLPLTDVVSRLRDVRRRLLAWVRDLTPEAAARIGLHPTFGEMAIARWLEFFLVHEAHHLYVAMVRLGEARQAVRR